VAVKNPPRPTPEPPPWRLGCVHVVVLVAALAVGLSLASMASSRTAIARTDASASGRLASPPATEYDALLVSRTDSRRVLLGTQHGLFATTDGGRSWKPAGLRGRAITSLGQVGRIILAGGPQVFASSDDGGQTWRRIHPRGLPSDKVIALATSPNRSTVYVLLLGAGLYRSTDRARSFTVVSPTVGPAIRSLALTSRHVIAGDISTGVYISPNGQDWLHTARGMIMALAVGGAKHKQVLAASWGISRSSDGGRRWRTVMHSHAMFGAVAFAPGRPSLAYAVADDHSFWRSTDGGVHWRRVTIR